MGYYDGQVHDDVNIIIEFRCFHEALRQHFPGLGYAENEQGDPQEVLTSILDQIETEVGDFFQRRGKRTYRSLVNSNEEGSTTCSNCGVTRIQTVKTKFRKFNIDHTVKAVQKMDDLMKTIITNENIPDYECHSEECKGKHQGRHPAAKSFKVVGTPKFIFIFTGIVKLVTSKRGETTMRKAMNFRIKLEESILIENINYRLRTVLSHTGDNSHLKGKKGKQTVQSGHYISYRRVSKLWYCFDDDNVFEVKFAQVGDTFQTEKVYMLLYEKKDENVN